MEVYDYKTQADFAMHLSRVGRFKEAITILRNVYQHQPDENKIAFNLSLLHEMSGEIDSSLIIIERVLKKLPSNYKGKEWLQKKVIQAKIIIKKNPEWIQHNCVLCLKVKHAKQIFIKSSEGSFFDKNFEQNNSLLAVMQHGIKTRMPYSKDPDLVLSKLITEAAELMAQEFSMEHAIALYYLAKEYDPHDKLESGQKILNLKFKMDQKKIKNRDEKAIQDWLLALKRTPLVEDENDIMFSPTFKQLKRTVEYQDRVEAEEKQKKERENFTITDLSILAIALALLITAIFIIKKM